MAVQNSDPLWRAAERAADCISEHGYAFVEDDKLEALAAVLRSFLTATGIPVKAEEAPGVAPAAIGSPSIACPVGDAE
jgi:hypothetical protein